MKKRCDEKKHFATQKDARRQMYWLKRSGKMPRASYLNAFGCKKHRCWHLGNSYGSGAKNREYKALDRMDRIFADIENQALA